MKKLVATNTFQNGLIMDFNPLVSPDGILTHCLNGTTLTYNGNENVLQNDMGNGRVETAFLPEGYIPLGTAELGGIIYIVSYNPQTDKCQIGSFPSPERNISATENYKDSGQSLPKLSINDLIKKVPNQPKEVISTSKKLVFEGIELHPGDKFKVFADNLYPHILSAYGSTIFNTNDLPRQLKLRVASIDNNGKITYLDNSIKWGKETEGTDESGNKVEQYYYIGKGKSDTDLSKIDTDDYRTQLASEYSVFQSKTSGKLCIVAELEVINSFDVSWDAITVEDKEDKEVNLYFFANWTYENDLPQSKSEINPSEFYICHKTSSDKQFSEVKKYDYTFGNSQAIQDPSDQSNVFPNQIKGTNPRKNDGSDPDITIKYDIPFKQTGNIDKEQIVTFKVIPSMIFGTLPQLEHIISIDINKIGNWEATSLKRWRYFNSDTECTLQWGFDMYPESHKSVENITFSFYKINNNIVDILKNNNIDCNEQIVARDQKGQLVMTNILKDEGENKVYERIISNKISYSGRFQDTFNLGSELFPEQCYLVQIDVKYGQQDYFYYKILYTTKQWNQKYLDKEEDFGSLKLNLSLKFNTKTESKVNRTRDNDNIPMLSSQQITINKGNIESNKKNLRETISGQFDIHTELKVKEGEELFKITDATASLFSNESDFKDGHSEPKYDAELLYTNKELLDTSGDFEPLIDDPNILFETVSNPFTSEFNSTTQTLISTYRYLNTVTTPILVEYENTAQLYPNYFLTNLKVSPTLLLGAFVRKSSPGCWYELRDSWDGITLASQDWQGGDKGYVQYVFPQLESIYNYIIDNYSDYDIIPMVIALRGSWGNSDKRHFKWVRINNGDWDYGVHAKTILVKCQQNKWLPFSYPTSQGLYNSYLDRAPVQSWDQPDFDEEVLNNFHGNIVDAYNSYYKLVDNSDRNISVDDQYIITNINSYKDYKYFVNLKIKINNIKIELNGANLSEESIINNLTLENILTGEELVSYNNQIGTEQIIESFDTPSIQTVIETIKDGVETYNIVPYNFTNTAKLYMKDFSNNISIASTINIGTISPFGQVITKPQLQQNLLVLPDITIGKCKNGVEIYYDDETSVIKTIDGSN